MTNESMKKLLIKASVFSFVSIVLMLQRSATKHIMIADAAGTAEIRVRTEESYNLLIDKKVTGKQQGKLIIPLSKSVGSDNITVEDNYPDHELLIYIDNLEDGFFKDTAVKTDLGIIEDAVCMTESESDTVCLDFKLDGLYANETSLTESNTIEVRFFKPSEKYDRIVVVDPAAGGSDTGATGSGFYEKKLSLDVALELKSLADKDDSNNIKFYFTRLKDKDTEFSERAALIDEVGADLLVGIGADSGSEYTVKGVQTRYYDGYYLRKLDNAELADIIERNCVENSGANAAGMEVSSDEDELLASSRIPSCRVIIGNLGSEDDVEYLSNSSYAGKIASGIYSGVIEAFGAMEDG